MVGNSESSSLSLFSVSSTFLLVTSNSKSLLSLTFIVHVSLFVAISSSLILITQMWNRAILLNFPICHLHTSHSRLYVFKIQDKGTGTYGMLLIF